MENLSPKDSNSLRRILLSGIIFVTFFQLLTEFIEAIYLFGLLGTEIPAELGLVVLFFSPLFLLVLKNQLTSPIGQRILLSIAFLARALEIALPTRGRLIFSGIGFAAILLFIPAYLSTTSKSDLSREYSKETGAGLSLAVFALILSRALNSGSDITGVGMFRIISWAMVIVGLVFVWRPPFLIQDRNVQSVPGHRSKIYLSTLGLASIIVILYFVITAPNIISRWGNSSNQLIHLFLLAAWLLISFWWLKQKTVSTKLVLGLGIAFVISLVLSILPHQVEFPPSMDTGYPLPAPQIAPWQSFPAYIMVALSPVLLIAFVHYLNEIIKSRPTPGVLAGAFSIGAGFILMMVLSQVFTTVYDYIPLIGPSFRDKYWLILLIPGILSFLPLLHNLNQQFQTPALSIQKERFWLWSSVLFTAASLVGLILTSASPSPPSEEKNSLRVFTYNIQQGFDDFGERNFDGQLKLVRSMSPDLIGLQECDTARIAGGNADVVAYFANHLNMYSYYGPSSVSGTFGIALLSRYPIENAATYYLFSKGEQVAVIEADIKVDDKTFKVYVTHLGNGGPIFQMRQMLELMENQSNVIAMGDFNFRPYEEQYAITTIKFIDSYLIAQQKTIPTQWGTSEPFDIEERIDHIFVSQELNVSYLEYFTQPESDHPGLFAAISW